MSEYLNEDICEFSNDATASSFGWNFQSNAGIFLFLKYIYDAKSIKIESKLQDIEISTVSGGKILAQVKSSQDYTEDTNKREKFKDAIISLAKFSEHGDKLIYISNIPDTIMSANGAFDNSIRSYSECLKGIRNEVDGIFESACKSITNKIEKAKSAKAKANGELILDLVRDFDKSKLYISVINPFWGSEVDRYSQIYRVVLEFLSNDVRLNSGEAIAIARNLMEHWQAKFSHNSTVPDNNISKSITREDFVWPVVVFLSDTDIPDIDDCLSFAPDQALKTEVARRLSDVKMVFHERFEFSYQVIQDYLYFRRSQPNTVKDVEKKYIQLYGDKFRDEFRISDDEEETEYITKAYIYKILMNHRNMAKIQRIIGG